GDDGELAAGRGVLAPSGVGPRHASALRDAMPGPRILADGALGAHHAVGDAGGAGRGLYPDRPRQGCLRSPRVRTPRAAECHAAGRHGDRPPVRWSAGRCRDDRDRLRVARRGDPHPGLDPQEGFPGGHSRGPAGRHRLHSHQPDPGPPLRASRPEDPPAAMAVPGIGTSESLPLAARDRGGLRVAAASRRRARLGIAASGGLAILATTLLAAVLAPLVAPHGYDDQDLARGLQPPVWSGGTWENALGTDQLGRDILSRLIYGARTSMLLAGMGVAIASVVGVLVGLISGYFSA